MKDYKIIKKRKGVRYFWLLLRC